MASHPTEKNDLIEYIEFLQKRNYVHLENAIRETGRNSDVVNIIVSNNNQETIRLSSSREQEEIRRSSDAVRRSVEAGFDSLSKILTETNSSIETLSCIVDHGFSLMVEQLSINNFFLAKIEDLLRIPDKHKDRIYYIEDGLKYFLAALKKEKNHHYYSRAIEKFHQSLAIEKEDFFSLYYIGHVHLYALVDLDFEKAEDFFRKSAYYCSIEADVGGTSFSRSTIKSNINFAIFAANAYLHAAFACYKQKKYSDSVTLALEANKVAPQYAVAEYNLAKYLVVDGKAEEAADILEKVIKSDLHYYDLAHADPYFNTSDSHVAEKLKYIYKSISDLTQQKLVECYKAVNPILKISSSIPYVSQIEKLMEHKDFLKLHEANGMFIEKKEWMISKGATIDSNNVVKPNIGQIQYAGPVLDFILFERKSILAIPIAENLMRILNLEEKLYPMRKQLASLQDELKIRIKNRNERLIMILFVLVGLMMFVSYPFYEQTGNWFIKFCASSIRYMFVAILILSGSNYLKSFLKAEAISRSVSEEQEKLAKTETSIAEIRAKNEHLVQNLPNDDVRTDALIA